MAAGQPAQQDLTVIEFLAVVFCQLLHKFRKLFIGYLFTERAVFAGPVQGDMLPVLIFHIKKPELFKFCGLCCCGSHAPAAFLQQLVQIGQGFFVGGKTAAPGEDTLIIFRRIHDWLHARRSGRRWLRTKI